MVVNHKDTEVVVGNQNGIVDESSRAFPTIIPGTINAIGGATFIGPNVSGNTFKWGATE